ncbi:MAG: hypothetical protein Q4B42_05755 [Oscillospiraceae bacterium]|nr:hypothetical protein [Oscillospiraceae bacterium]
MKRRISRPMSDGLARPGSLTLDLHGKNSYQARVAINAALRRSRGLYRLRLVHGFHSGTALRDMITEEYDANPLVKRVVRVSDGVTELVLRES